MTEFTIGIDVSKDHLDIHRLPDGATFRVVNSADGLAELVVWIGEAPVARLVYEATGAYHRLLETTLAAHGLPIAKVNPRQARRFAEAAGVLAKTDRVDAAVLARFGVALEPAVTKPRNGPLDALRELHLARQALVKDRTAAKNRLAVARSALVRRLLSLRLAQIERDISAIDAAIQDHLRTEDGLARRATILTSIPGVSTLTAVAMMVEMPELGTLGGKQAASLAGLAPMTRQSGTWRGRATIRGGRAMLRQALYMPTLVATRFNPDLKAKYEAMIAAGKPKKLAITALMRKILLLANALLRDNRTWIANPA